MVSLVGESASLSPRRACHGHRRSFNSRDSMPPPDYIITPPTSPTTASLLAASASLSRSARHGRRRTFSPRDAMPLHDFVTTPPTSPSNAQKLTNSSLVSSHVDALQTDAVNTAAHCEDKPVPLPEHTNQVLLYRFPRLMMQKATGTLFIFPTHSLMSKQKTDANFGDGDMATIVTLHHARRRRMSHVRMVPTDNVRITL